MIKSFIFFQKQFEIKTPFAFSNLVLEVISSALAETLMKYEKAVSPRFKRKLAAALSLSALSLAAAAQESPLPESNFKLSGFATLGLTYNDNSDKGAITNFSQKNPANKGWSGNLDTVGGLQMEWRPAVNTSLVVQGVARAGNDFDPELRMGYLRQQFENDLAIRLGRIRNPLYQDSDVTEIGYAYLMVRPPLPLYGIANNINSVDGADVQWRHAIGNIAFLVQAYMGQSDYKHRFYNLTPVSEADAKLRGMSGLSFSASLPNVTARFSRTWVDSYTLRSSEISQLNSGLSQLAGGVRALAGFLPGASEKAAQIESFTNPYDNRPIYTSLGFDASIGQWRLLGEWTVFDSRSSMVGKYNGSQLTLGRSFGDWTPYISYARQKRSSTSVDTSAFSATGLSPALDGNLANMQAALNQAAQYSDLSMRSVSVGVRYDLRDGMALKAQYDRIQSPNGNVPGYFAISRLPAESTVNLFTLALDVIF
ncbi:MAG: porin [Zoogloea sp.]|uniref:porin n=1 Tax=Zoogloea sp. TaxID=49181 RepID=UPI003F2F3F2D